MILDTGRKADCFMIVSGGLWIEVVNPAFYKRRREGRDFSDPLDGVVGN